MYHRTRWLVCALFIVMLTACAAPAQGQIAEYADLGNYLEQKLGRPVERIQRRTYAEINDLLRTGEVDLAFVCTSSYWVGLSLLTDLRPRF